MYTQEQLEAHGLHDFRVFLRQVWAHLNLPKPTPVQNDIAKVLQHGPDRTVIQAFRGVGKSWITAAFVLFTALHDAQKKIVVVSASQQLADDFSRFTKRLIDEMPLLQFLAPSDDQRRSNVSFDFGPALAAKDPSVTSKGITGQLTGLRADLLIADDVEVPKNSYTHDMREKLAAQTTEFEALLKPGGRIVYLGTPQTESSLYRRLEDRGYEVFVWPVEVPEDPYRYSGKTRKLAPLIQKMMDSGTKAGTPVEPARFPEIEILKRRAAYGKAGFALQYMLDTSLSDAERHPLRCEDLIIHQLDREQGPVKLVWGADRTLRLEDLPCGGLEKDAFYRNVLPPDKLEFAPWGGTVMAIDPSGRGTDETAWAIVRLLYKQLYVVSVGGVRDGYGEGTLKLLAAKAAEFKVNDIIVEQTYGGGMFDKLFQPVLQRYATARILDPNNPEDRKRFDPWPRTRKEDRIIDVLEPVMSQHLLVFDRKVIEDDNRVLADSPAYSLIYQMTRITRDPECLAHDDRLDALAHSVAYWTKALAADKERLLENRRAQLLDEELKNWGSYVFGGQRKRYDTFHRPLLS